MARRAAVAGRAAIAAVLISQAVLASPQQDYVLNCMGCHGSSAQGVPGKVPPLANSLSRFLRTESGRNYILRVPGAANSSLSDEQLAGVLNWLALTFNADAPPRKAITSQEVSRWRHTPLPSVLATRSAVVRELAATGPSPAAQY
jgi:mono/diheme cytochrome c family protein